MKKFEEEFNYLIELSGKVLTGQIEAEEFEKHRTDFIKKYGEKTISRLQRRNEQLDGENLALHDKIENLQSQLEKQQPEIPEVPQFVADWYEQGSPIFIETCIFDFILSNPQRGADASSEFEKWFMENNNSIEILMDMKRLGYTVAKEKRFYLKNKFTGNYLSSVPESNNFYHIMVRDPNVNGLVRSFTQQEIESLETGSYEQIPVEEDK